MEADVLSLGYRGEGVAKIDRLPVFVKGALPGERIRYVLVLMTIRMFLVSLAVLVTAAVIWPMMGI